MIGGKQINFSDLSDPQLQFMFYKIVTEEEFLKQINSIE